MNTLVNYEENADGLSNPSIDFPLEDKLSKEYTISEIENIIFKEHKHSEVFSTLFNSTGTNSSDSSPARSHDIEFEEEPDYIEQGLGHEDEPPMQMSHQLDDQNSNSSNSEENDDETHITKNTQVRLVSPYSQGRIKDKDGIQKKFKVAHLNRIIKIINNFLKSKKGKDLLGLKKIKLEKLPNKEFNTQVKINFMKPLLKTKICEIFTTKYSNNIKKRKTNQEHRSYVIYKKFEK
jgi:hypothetical protein